jgi:thiamine pyrophosphate-dependent acetolactate synthase large subunit-like protein
MLESQIKVGVAIATSGQGATNLITDLADALIDSTPMGVLQRGSHLLERTFQETDIVGISQRLLLNGTRKSLKAADILKY